MDDEAKYGRDTMNKVLGWGTIVYFLVLGFSLNQHALFELYPPQAQEPLENAKNEYARTIESQVSKPTDDKQAELKMKAAQAKLDAELLKEERIDARFRAFGLIIGAGMFCLGYPIAVYLFYRKSVIRYNAPYFISQRLALAYAVSMSVVTFYVAFLTAYR